MTTEPHHPGVPSGTLKVPYEAADALKSYVYVYIDPRDEKPFYIGKGKADRLFSHLRLDPQPDDPSESKKVLRIAELRAAGVEPRIDLLCYGLSDPEASLVEAAAIDLIGRPPLTNIMAGTIPTASVASRRRMSSPCSPRSLSSFASPPFLSRSTGSTGAA